MKKKFFFGLVEEPSTTSTEVPASQRTNVRSEFKITNTPWDSKLGDATSQEFRTLADKLHTAVYIYAKYIKKNYIYIVTRIIRERFFFEFSIDIDSFFLYLFTSCCLS